MVKIKSGSVVIEVFPFNAKPSRQSFVARDTKNENVLGIPYGCDLNISSL